jgi:Tol biopolymer transport system component
MGKTAAPNWAIAYSHWTSYGIRLGNFDGSKTLDITTPPSGGYDMDARWSPDGKQVAFWRYYSGTRVIPLDLFVVNADGTGLRSILHWDATTDHPFPNNSADQGTAAVHGGWAPYGGKLLYPVAYFDGAFADTPYNDNDVAVLDVATGEVRMVGLRGLNMHPVDVACGPFNAAGQGTLVVSGFMYHIDPTKPPGGQIVPDGDLRDLILVTVQADAQGWLSPVGTPVRITLPNFQTCPTVSPDGKHIAYTDNGSSPYKVWVLDVDLTTLTVTGGPRDWTRNVPSSTIFSGGCRPWSSDNRWIAFDAIVGNQRDVLRVQDGGRTPVNMTGSNAKNDYDADWNPKWDPSKP